MEEIAKHGSLHEIPGIPERAKDVFKTSHDIAFEWHVRHQAAFQRSTDNGVSKTINLPNDATEDDVARAYKLAWELGCIGITVFRDGCKGEQVLNIGVGKKKEQTPVPAIAGTGTIKPRPHSLRGTTYRMETPIGTAFITVNETAEGDPFEVFLQVGKGGSDTMAVAEALGRLISLTLRMPSPLSTQRRLEEVISQLSRIGGAQPVGFGPSKVLSLPDALARCLAEHIGQIKTAESAQTTAAAKKTIGDSARSAARRPSFTRKAARSASPAVSTSARPSEGGFAPLPTSEKERAGRLALFALPPPKEGTARARPRARTLLIPGAESMDLSVRARC
jgi:ribonucleoside-diphosphate reductase alpha chain